MRIIIITNPKKQDYLWSKGVYPVAEYKKQSMFLNTPELKKTLQSYAIEKDLFKNQIR